MTSLRQRVLDELQRRNYSPATTRGYILAIQQFADYFGKSPEHLGGDEIRQFETYLLRDRKLAPGTVEGRMSALRFLYKKTLKRRDIAYDDLIFPKTPRKLPVVLSPAEGSRMIQAAPNLMHPTILMVLYATGIRRTEASLCLPWPVSVVGQREGIRSFLRTLFREDWVVYAKAPFGGPEHVLQYLARYTHRVAISNHRLLSVDGDRVTFRWKDYAHHSTSRAMTLPLEEFLRRFLQHVLPKGLPRIRYFGWLANRRRRELLPLCRRLLAVAPPPAEAKTVATAVWQCPICGSPMRVVELLTAAQIQQEQGHQVYILDSS